MAFSPNELPANAPDEEFVSTEPAIDNARAPDRRVLRSHRFEVGPVLFPVRLPEVQWRGFRIADLLGILSKTCSDSMTHGSMTRESAFMSLWRHRGGHDMVTFKLLHTADVETPYAY